MSPSRYRSPVGASLCTGRATSASCSVIERTTGSHRVRRDGYVLRRSSAWSSSASKTGSTRSNSGPGAISFSS